MVFSSVYGKCQPKVVLTTVWAVGFMACSCCWAGYGVSSPDGRLRLKLLVEGGTVCYAVSAGQSEIIAPTPIRVRQEI